MFDLVFKHQRSRIMSYLEWLKHAFQPEKSTAHRPSKQQATLMETRVESQPLLKTRIWTDDNGYEFEIPINPLAQVDEISEAVQTGESLKDIDIVVSDLFEKIHKLCAEVCPETQETLLKQLMYSMFDLWKGGRTQSAIKSYLHQHFGENRKRKREAERALLLLCKIYCGVRDFIDAAERLRIFKSIQYVPIRYQASSLDSDTSPRQTTPLEVAKCLGVTVQRPDWIGYLNREGTRFATLLKEKRYKRHFHAEIQALHHHGFSLSPDERKHTHPYIGCSRRCCLLCYFFILVHGGFGVRGTHETIIHRWEIPKHFLVGHAGPVTDFQCATERLLDIVKRILQGLFKMSYPANHRELLAQSSDALSSAQIIPEKESTPLEKSQREIQ